MDLLGLVQTVDRLGQGIVVAVANAADRAAVNADRLAILLPPGLPRISPAWRSSRFSRSRALIRARSSLLGPSRSP